MLHARKSAIVGRKHKMVFVDFSNPYLRDYLGGYCEAHRRHLDGVRERLPSWVATARAAEGGSGRAAEGGSGRPLAAVFDIDEVVLANIHMNVFQAPAGAQGAAAIDFHACDHYLAPNGLPWPRDDLRLNPLLPGARELMEACRALGVEIFFITGRLESIRDETVENFVFVGLAGGHDSAGSTPLFTKESIATPGGRLVMCPDAEYPPPGQTVRPYKESRRRVIQETHRIVLNIGDQVSDLGLYGDVQVHCPHPFYYTS
jgi:HAD superfamily, subfamily IIIB (Acid phosphatase)